MLLDAQGQPLQKTAQLSLKGKWSDSTAYEYTFNNSAVQRRWAGYGSRAEARRQARVAYMTNPIVFGAVNLIAALVTGNGLSYKEIHDAKLRDTLDDFWVANDLSNTSRQIYTQYLIDGLAVLLSDISNTGRGQPARVLAVNPLQIAEYEQNLFKDTVAVSVQLTSAQLQRFEQGQFVWNANTPLYGDKEGWSTVMSIAQTANTMTGLLEYRLAQHDIASRINAVYKTMLDREDMENPVQNQLDRVRAQFTSVPPRSSVMVIGKDLETGHSEEFEFTRSNVNFSDIQNDWRSLMMILSLVTGLPEHYLGEGGTATRTTAESMTVPARASIEAHQGAFRVILNGLVRNEAVRRNPNAKYKTRVSRIINDGRDRITSNRMLPIELVEIPWTFPTIEQADITGLVAKVQAAATLGLASKPTLQQMLGIDPSIEAELMADPQSQSQSQRTERPKEQDNGR